MDLILCVIIVLMIHIGLIAFAKWAEKHFCAYDPIFCQDVRANLGMFVYKSDVERMRKKLNNPKSKF